MSTNTPMEFSAEALAQDEAKVWDNSAYYADAENWTWLFWDEEYWFRSLFNKLDLRNILELACGHGRHARYLLENYYDKVGHLTIMDILESNIQFCNKSFGLRKNLTIVQNSGTNFYPLEKESLTAIYCYDAMVHFDERVVKSYIEDAHRVLVSGGRALFHHSNYSANPESNFGMNPHARAHMSGSMFMDYSAKAGFQVLEQRIIPWGNIEGLDCISLIQKVPARGAA